MPVKILVVDDELSIERLFSRCFKQQIHDGKFEFTYVYDGQQALEKIHTSLPDLMLLDLRMPNLDGFGLLRQLKQENLHLKTIIVSALGTVQNIRRAYEEGVLNFLSKPVKRQELESAIDKALKHKDGNRVRIKAPAPQESEEQKKTAYGTVLQLAEELYPFERYKLISRLLKNLSLDEIEQLQGELKELAEQALKAAQKEEEKWAKIALEDQKRQEEGKLSLALLEKGYIEEKTQSYQSSSGEKVYRYLILRWVDPKTKKLRSRSLNKKELQDPLVRQIIERKLGSSIAYFQ